MTSAVESFEAAMKAANVPPGWSVMPFHFGFVGVNGPLYVKPDNGDLLVGFRVEERHCNPMKTAHGGMMSLFADMLMPIAARFQAEGMADKFLPTIHLGIDFLGTAPLGSWVEGRTRIGKVTRKMVFADCFATADGEPCLRANGVFKIGPVVAPLKFVFDE
jgi:acyl-coenzyme A thioesterase PaaI-like protein